MFGLDVASLKPGLHTFELAPTPEELDLDPATFSEVAVRIRLDLEERRMLVTFEARATAALVCDRTLEPFAQVVAGRHAVVFVEPERLLAEARALGGDLDDDVRPLPDPGAPLDLTDLVRDTLLLALPVRRVAPGAEERAIPLVFGPEADEAMRPADPRWSALRDLDDGPRPEPDSPHP